MKKSGTVIVATVLASALSVPAMAEFSIDANIEINTDAIDTPAETKFTQGGRVEVNVHGFHEMNGYRIRAKASGLLAKDGGASTDDMWVQFGTKGFDLQVGRFEAANLFPLGKDTLIVHAGDDRAQVYEANAARGRVGDDAGQVAAHFNMGSSLSFELGTIFGDAGGDDSDDTTAFSGVRPVVTFSGDNISLSAGYESVKYENAGTTTKDLTGFALTGSTTVSGVALNISVAMSDDNIADTTVNSLGVNMISGNLGLGLIYSETDLAGTVPDPEVTTAYLAYTIPMPDFDDATVTLATSYSTADNAGTEDKTLGGRVRINYAF